MKLYGTELFTLLATLVLGIRIRGMGRVELEWRRRRRIVFRSSRRAKLGERGRYYLILDLREIFRIRRILNRRQKESERKRKRRRSESRK